MGTQTASASTPPARRVATSLGASLPVRLARSAHPAQATLTAAGVTLAAALAGRPASELLLVAATVATGQAIAGWTNDLADRDRDRRHQLGGKPLADGVLEPGTVWFAVACALLLVVPLSVAAGPRSAAAYLGIVLVSVLANRFLRRGALSFVPWVVSFALYPAYLAYGGGDGVGTTTPPTLAMTSLAALLGLCAHVLRSLPGLVPDNDDGWRTLPLRVALRTGAPRLLWGTGAATVVIVVAMAVTGRTVGLT